MSIVKMDRLHLIAMQSDQEEILKVLQRMGCVEIGQLDADLSSPEWEGFSHPDSAALNQARDNGACAAAALTALNKYAPAKSGLLQARPLVSEQDFFDDSAYAKALEAAQAITGSERHIQSLYAEQSKLRAQKAALAPWLPLEIPLDSASTKEVTVQFGTIPSRTALGDVIAALANASPLAQLLPSSSDSDAHYVLFLCHNSAVEEASSVLKEFGFSPASLKGWTGTAKANDKAVDDAIRQAEAGIEAEKKNLSSYASQRAALERCADRANQEAARQEAKSRLLDTDAAFYLDGWVPVEEEARLTKALAPFTCAWETVEPSQEEYPQVPVKLKNNIFSRCMNVVTEMYSLPAYGSIDPNPLMAPFFIVFFGIMMADIAYGILMIAASLVVLLKTRPRPGTRNFMELVFWCGVSTLIVGAMTGGFLGDFIPQFIKLFNPDSTFEWFWPPLFTPLNNTVEILIGSLVLGVIQVFTGMGVGVYKKIKSGNFIDALFDEFTWWIIIAGGVLAIFGIGSVAGVPVVLVIGALMLAIGGTRNAKGFGKVTSLVGLVYNGVTGYFSDILSYMRLMALMLSGSVIAQVFNTLASVVGGMVPGVGIVLFIVISLVGNALNLALNLLGCYVHDLRLQCLEFFNRFYEEGGKPFKPLVVETKYVDVIKEDN